ncbi:MAG: hypothetical protein AAGB97_00740 [Dehalococcoidia bacterium]|nr:hypothetical protein [Chloroflexota bacterium]MBT9159593.1 hypothetical protein [Chloroflexota bacterium]MBT9162787.1 hypothetical protein [Chloroflexota bacterium]
MLTMAQIQYIKHLRDKKDKGIAEIAEIVDAGAQLRSTPTGKTGAPP